MLLHLNLTKNYCPDWGFWEAIREIIQNGDDQERNDKTNKFSIVYNEKKQTLVLSNKESILTRDTILMGNSVKVDDPNATGQYGEGYKVALAVLTRLGKRVIIKNFKLNEKWEPVLKVDKNYNNATVLKLKISKYIFRSTPDNNLSWEIKDVTLSEWKSIQNKYLGFNKQINKFTDREKESVLFDRQYKGCVFVNDLFVEKSKENLAFGYNFTPTNIKLDRDRRSVESFYLKYYAAKILSQYGNGNEKNAKKLISLINKDYDDIEYINSHTNLNNFIVKEVQYNFEKKHGKNAYPVSTQEEFEIVTNTNSKIKPVITKKSEADLIKKSSVYKDLESFCENKNIKIEDQSPSQILNAFLLKHNENLSYETKEDLQEIISQSKKWNSANEVVKEDKVVEVVLS